MGKMNMKLTAILLVVVMVFTGLMEKGEAQGCEWECKGLPNFKCYLGGAGHKLCDDFCMSEGANHGICVSDVAANFHRCLCRKAVCS